MSEPLEKYRTFWRRLGAALIDGLVFMPIVLIETWIIFGIPSIDPFMTDDYMFYIDSLVDDTIVLTVVHTALIFTYSIWMTQRFGQTIGKMATGIIILDEETETHPISLVNAICRDLPLLVVEVLAIIYMIITRDLSEESIAMKVLSFASGIWILAELITMFQNPRRRAIHDIFARSVVVRLESKRLVNDVTT